jgi:hypothetical protein
VVRADTWSELAVLLQENRYHTVGVDPSADGTMNIEAVRDLMRRFAPLPFFAYVSPTALSLKAILELSRHGLREVFLQPLRDALRFEGALEMLATEGPVLEFLRMLEGGARLFTNEHQLGGARSLFATASLPFRT